MINWYFVENSLAVLTVRLAYYLIMISNATGLGLHLKSYWKLVLWNISFSIPQKKVWSGFGKNNESVGELWVGLLRFYTEDFDFHKHVVCIRQKKLLTSFEKVSASK